MDGVYGNDYGNRPSVRSGPDPARTDAGGYVRRDNAGSRDRTNADPGMRYQRPPAGTSGTFAIKSEDLEPVMAADGSGLPHGLWQGLSIEDIERFISGLQIPPRSPALHDLWHRLLKSEADMPAGSSNAARFAAIRIESLYRSGLILEISQAFDERNELASDPLVALLLARTDIALGREERGCAAARNLTDQASRLAPRFAAEAIMLTGFCAAVDGNPAAAGLAADLAREGRNVDATGLSALDDIAAGAPPRASTSGPIDVIEYRLLSIGKGELPADLLDRANPALLAVIARDSNANPQLQLAAAEAAARINALSIADLAAVYERVASDLALDTTRPRNTTGTTRAAPSDPAFASSTSAAQERAALFMRAILEQTPGRKASYIRQFLDSARRHGLYLQTLKLMAPAAESLSPGPDIDWFTETAIEVALAANNPAEAHRWATFAGQTDQTTTGPLGHWNALIDIATASPDGYRRNTDHDLASVERLALEGQFEPVQLHRLATVLDALRYDIPIPLWEAASRTPQPSGGHLPETGVLSELQQAAARKEFARTVLLAMRSLGPDGAEGAHMIALGDAIRALSRAGLEADARRLAFEAVFAAWPRTQRR